MYFGKGLAERVDRLFVAILIAVVTGSPFLTAQWRDLVLLNYEVPGSLLRPLVPSGTELDAFDGRFLASVVGFRFLDSRLRGWPVPFHRDFEEVNLRFYVRRDAGPNDSRRAVVFVKELVPKRAVAWLARLAYNEPYRQAPMSHRIERSPGSPHPSAVTYRWVWAGTSHSLQGRLAQPPTTLSRPSEAEFITEHYWGYGRQRDGSTLEYRVAHPSWEVADLTGAELQGDAAALYGRAWAEVLAAGPRSAFYAVGSAVEVFPGTRLPSDRLTPPIPSREASLK